MSNLYLYFSGTGNTKYVLKKWIEEMSDSTAVLQSIEHENVQYKDLIEQADTIVIAYPIYGSMLPMIMNSFVRKNKTSFQNKKVSVIITQKAFSGDGAALVCRLLKSVHPQIINTIHINMPVNTPDIFFMGTKTLKDSTEKLREADRKIQFITQRIKRGYHYKMGRKWYSWIIGFFFQRLYMIPVHGFLQKRIMIDDETCIGCNKCVTLCPVNNLYNDNGRIKTNNQCTLCYRCINSCPTKSISLFTKKGPKIQYIIQDYK